jgi:hypothetical protein
MKLHSLRFAPLAVLTVLGFAGAFAACSAPATPLRICDDPGPILIRGAQTGFDFCTGGPAHRSKIVACAAFEHAAGKCGGTEMFPMSSECANNADCIGKQIFAPVCFAAPGNVSCSCAPSCVNDADCGPDALCQCGDPISFCRQALCRTDADCEDGALCMDSEIESCGVRGFACQSPLDECLSSLDCAAGIQCIYITDHRVCSNKGCEG